MGVIRHLFPITFSLAGGDMGAMEVSRLLGGCYYGVYFVLRTSTGVVLCNTGVVLEYYFVVPSSIGLGLCGAEKYWSSSM